ncbi:MAG: hypothetical protein ABI728_15850 [Betaproteobacteria bacterium]
MYLIGRPAHHSARFLAHDPARFLSQGSVLRPGILDGSLDVPAFWYGKNTALSLFGTGPAFGFPDVAKVCMVQSFHQPGECFQILIKRKAWDALPEIYRNVLRIASKAASADMYARTLDLYSQKYEETRDQRGVKFVETPADILNA